MSFKQKVLSHLLFLLEEKINSLQVILVELEEGSQSDNKSSAGDKHETARAMMQLEQEKISKQLKEVLAQKTDLTKMGYTAPSLEIKKGSLVNTGRGFVFIAVAYGKIIVDETTVMAISPSSPLGAALLGKTRGSETHFNSIRYHIKSIE